jgi:uncharacterized Ntn-hydrolase superfamily protein
MAKKSDQDVERVPSKGDLEKLIKASQVSASEGGAAREKLSRAYAAVEKKGLNKKAFRMVYDLWRMDQVRMAHTLRAFTVYVDLLGLDVQTDIEDVIAEDEASPEASEQEALKNGGAAALKRFKRECNGCEDVERVQSIRDDMVSNWPELEQHIFEIAEKRIGAISH